ncbi:hypothetical protein MTO96_022812 [Rhipicephalus appendiculatus]
MKLCIEVELRFKSSIGDLEGKLRGVSEVFSSKEQRECTFIDIVKHLQGHSRYTLIEVEKRNHKATTAAATSRNVIVHRQEALRLPTRAQRVLTVSWDTACFFEVTIKFLQVVIRSHPCGRWERQCSTRSNEHHRLVSCAVGLRLRRRKRIRIGRPCAERPRRPLKQRRLRALTRRRHERFQRSRVFAKGLLHRSTSLLVPRLRVQTVHLQRRNTERRRLTKPTPRKIGAAVKPAVPPRVTFKDVKEGVMPPDDTLFRMFRFRGEVRERIPVTEAEAEQSGGPSFAATTTIDAVAK